MWRKVDVGSNQTYGCTTEIWGARTSLRGGIGRPSRLRICRYNKRPGSNPGEGIDAVVTELGRRTGFRRQSPKGVQVQFLSTAYAWVGELVDPPS